MSIFTHKERTVKCKTLGQALSQAKRVLVEFHNTDKVCVNSLPKWSSLDDLITIEEMSDWVNEIVGETLFRQGY